MRKTLLILILVMAMIITGCSGQGSEEIEKSETDSSVVEDSMDIQDEEIDTTTESKTIEEDEEEVEETKEDTIIAEETGSNTYAGFSFSYPDYIVKELDTSVYSYSKSDSIYKMSIDDNTQVLIGSYSDLMYHDLDNQEYRDELELINDWLAFAPKTDEEFIKKLSKHIGYYTFNDARYDVMDTTYKYIKNSDVEIIKKENVEWKGYEAFDVKIAIKKVPYRKEDDTFSEQTIFIEGLMIKVNGYPYFITKASNQEDFSDAEELYYTLFETFEPVKGDYSLPTGLSISVEESKDFYSVKSNKTINGNKVLTPKEFSNKKLISGITPKELFQDTGYNFYEYEVIEQGRTSYFNDSLSLNDYRNKTRLVAHRKVMLDLGTRTVPYEDKFEIDFFTGLKGDYRGIIINELPYFYKNVGFDKLDEGTKNIFKRIFGDKAKEVYDYDLEDYSTIDENAPLVNINGEEFSVVATNDFLGCMKSYDEYLGRNNADYLNLENKLSEIKNRFNTLTVLNKTVELNKFYNEVNKNTVEGSEIPTPYSLGEFYISYGHEHQGYGVTHGFVEAQLNKNPDLVLNFLNSIVSRSYDMDDGIENADYLEEFFWVTVSEGTTSYELIELLPLDKYYLALENNMFKNIGEKSKYYKLDTKEEQKERESSHRFGYEEKFDVFEKPQYISFEDGWDGYDLTLHIYEPIEDYEENLAK